MKKTIAVRLEEEISKRLSEYCELHGIKKGWLCSRAVEDKLFVLLGNDNGGLDE